jgi:hypothetical protein
MSWTITPQTKVPVDPFRSQVSLLLHGDGANGSTTITDNSPTPKTVTAVGNAQISTAQSKFGGASIAFDGTGDWLTVPSNTAFQFGTGDFTLETWIRPASTITSNVILYDSRALPIPIPSGLLVLYVNTSRKPIIYIEGSGNIVIGNTSLNANTWYHLAAVKYAGSYYLYVDGVSDAISVINNVSIVQPINVRIGADYSDTGAFNGYIDDLRITKGIARYIANFTPPAAPFPDI